VHPLSDAEPSTPERTVRVMTLPASPTAEIKTVHRSAPAGVQPLSDAEPSTPERTVRMMTPPVSPTPEIKTVHRSARNGEQPQPAAEEPAQVQTKERETAAVFPKAEQRISPVDIPPLFTTKSFVSFSFNPPSKVKNTNEEEIDTLNKISTGYSLVNLSDVATIKQLVLRSPGENVVLSQSITHTQALTSPAYSDSARNQLLSSLWWQSPELNSYRVLFRKKSYLFNVVDNKVIVEVDENDFD
ncbi:hypothetical protein, partial [Citrobacter portucalensis]|uniref:hypothetical protein n=1 Tax=Citrobacter portucalensis TaxID=1639133 RepID=UPI00226B85B7